MGFSNMVVLKHLCKVGGPVRNRLLEEKSQNRSHSSQDVQSFTPHDESQHRNKTKATLDPTLPIMQLDSIFLPDRCPHLSNSTRPVGNTGLLSQNREKADSYHSSSRATQDILLAVDHLMMSVISLVVAESVLGSVC